jgi:calcium-dependent protein kinase
VRAVDTDKNGVISYTEFVAATMNANIFMDDGKLMTAFDMLDRDGDGYIEEKELAEILGYKDGNPFD